MLNGSRLGKEYAANAIVERLENPRQYEYLSNNSQPQGSAGFAPQQQPHTTHETQPIHRTEQYLESNEIGNSIGSLFDIPISPNGEDPEEEMFRRRMQRKKKKGRRM